MTSRDVLVPVLALTALAAAACGGSSSHDAPADQPTFQISATGIAPQSHDVANGGCVLVRNADAVSHDVAPDPLRNCPELVGRTTLAPGESWDWCGFQGGPKECGLADPTRRLPGGAQDPAFSATIRVAGP